MHKHLMTGRPRSKQRGVVLFVALMLLVILSLIGVTAARMQTVEERMARNEDNRLTGAQAAEAALRAAESNILTGIWSAAQFAANSNGLYALDATNGSVLQSGTFSWATQGIAYAGPNLSAIAANAQTPLYIVESLPPVAMPGDSINQVQYASPSSPVAVYRITAQGQGADQTSSTTLQSIFR
jgi:type IV pilus assembly protein PilX